MIYWAWFGLISLVILTFQDLKNNKKIDDRYNFFMYGVTATLLHYYPRSIWYMFAVLSVSSVMRLIIIKYNVIGKGDANTLMWLFLGFGYLNAWLLFSYIILFFAVYFFQMFIRRIVLRRKETLQGYPVFLFSFMLGMALLNWGII